MNCCEGFSLAWNTGLWFSAISDKTDVELNLLGQNRKHDD